MRDVVALPGKQPGERALPIGCRAALRCHDVGLGEHSHDLVAADDGHAGDPALDEQRRGGLERRLGANGEDRRRHQLVDARSAVAARAPFGATDDGSDVEGGEDAERTLGAGLDDDQVREIVLRHHLCGASEGLARANRQDLRRRAAAGGAFLGAGRCGSHHVAIGDDSPKLRVVLGNVAEADDAMDAPSRHRPRNRRERRLVGAADDSPVHRLLDEGVVDQGGLLGCVSGHRCLLRGA
jgi:hypothetical protein